MISPRSACIAFASFVAIALAATAIWPAEYYVSPAGDDANDGRSPSSPWRTIAKANVAVAPGDTVYLRGGRYENDPIRPARSGTSSAPIRYAAYRNETPVLTSDRAGGLDHAIDLTSRSYIVVDGIWVDGVEPSPASRVDHFVTIIDGSHNTIRNGRFRYATGWHGIRLKRSHHIELLDNVIDVVGIYDDGNGQDWGDSIQIDGESHHNLVEGNVVTRGAHNLLQVKGEHNVIRNNVFDNDWSDILGPGKGGRNLALMGRHNVFERNVVRHAMGSTDRARNAGMKVEGRRNIVRRNVIVANSNEGITTQSRGGQKWAHYNRIYHNTLYANGGPAWGLVFYDGGHGVTGNVFKNNIVYANRAAAGVADGDIVFQLKANPSGAIGESIIENNLIAGRARSDVAFDVRSDDVMSLAEAEKKYPRYVRGNIQGVPKFVVTEPRSLEDFALAPGSRGIDEGAPLTRTRGAGSGRTIPLEDAGYFTDGFSLVDGDRIRIGNEAPLTVVAVDYEAHTVTVDRDTRWTNGAPVSLDFTGAAPDIGAIEAAD
ncbi:MAG TPA: NosD domain-containing protein [Gammaproteobacteria bacterium]